MTSTQGWLSVKFVLIPLCYNVKSVALNAKTSPRCNLDVLRMVSAPLVRRAVGIQPPRVAGRKYGNEERCNLISLSSNSYLEFLVVCLALSCVNLLFQDRVTALHFRKAARSWSSAARNQLGDAIISKCWRLMHLNSLPTISRLVLEMESWNA